MVGTERFSSRWGLIVASLGMAVGAGNIWRFPRVVAQHGGGAFMIAWLVALFAWSIPLLVIEFSWGKKTRRGPVGAFVEMAGPRWAWAGGFISLCCTAIMFYYAVVTGWCLYYLGRSAIFGLQADSVQEDWEQFTGSGWAVACLALAVVIACGVVGKGIRHGIERVCKILVPALFVLLVVAAIRAMTMPGAAAGLDHLFRPNFEWLKNPELWLEAFSQSAWSTGAGWGLLLVYAGYARQEEDAVMNSCITGLGNNTASLLAALATVPTIFALLPQAQALEVALSGNEGLAFIWLPRLFLGGNMVGGPVFVVVFFAALAVAALSSLIAMVEFAVRTLIDLGIKRRLAVGLVGFAGFGFGLPSAVHMGFFKNQDWVWGLGLLYSGAFFALGTLAHGVGRLRRAINQTPDAWKLGRWFDLSVGFFVPISIVAMLVWWLYQASEWDPKGWYNPLGATSLGTCLAQWFGAVLVLMVINRWLVIRIRRSDPQRGEEG